MFNYVRLDNLDKYSIDWILVILLDLKLILKLVRFVNKFKC